MHKKLWSFEVERPFCVLAVDLYINALATNYFKTTFGLDFICSNYKIVKGREYWLTNDLTRLEKMYSDALTKQPNIFESLAQKTFTICNELHRQKDTILSSNWNHSPASMLSHSLENFCSYLLPVASAINMRPVEFIETRVVPVLEKINNQYHLTETLDELVGTIPNSVEKPLFYRSEPVDLLRIGSKIQNDKHLIDVFDLANTTQDVHDFIPGSIKRSLLNHTIKYSWMRLPYAAIRQDYTILDYIQRLQFLIAKTACHDEILRIKRFRREASLLYQKILARSRDVDRNLIIAARDYAFLRTYLSEVFDQALVVCRRSLLKQISNTIGLSDSQICSMTVDEILRSLAHGKSTVEESILAARANQFAYIFNNTQRFLLIRADEIQPYEDPVLENEQAVGPVTGLIASRGFVTGLAKIINAPEDCAKINLGDIVIASMTVPEYTVALEKASAFVTDEGGMTCHAAITSREFGVPCIVGTQVASQVFKDNDMLVVDALKGYVYKI